MNKDAGRLILKIDRLIYGGLALGRVGSRIFMIKGALLPDETVEVTIEQKKKDYSLASVNRILESSPGRIEPACPYFGSCGGCHLQHMPYAVQVRQKEDILKDSLRRLAKTEVDLGESLICDEPWRYRYRGQFKAAEDKVGFYRVRSRDLVEVEACPLMKDEINSALGEARGLLKGYQAREIHISCGDDTVAFLKIPAKFSRRGEDLDRLASDLINTGFSGVIINAGKTDMFSFGKPSLSLRLGDLQYSVSAMSFFQSSWWLNQSLVTFIQERLHPLKGKRVLDLYAGAGNFSLPLAEEAEVTGVEESPYAIEDGRRNLQINRINNYRFINSPAENYKPGGTFDVVLLDPPRAGLSNVVVKNVLAMKAERIVYISCNPATFSRDLKKLKAVYVIESIRMIDFFPQTFHIEALAFLRLR